MKGKLLQILANSLYFLEDYTLFFIPSLSQGWPSFLPAYPTSSAPTSLGSWLTKWAGKWKVEISAWPCVGMDSFCGAATPRASPCANCGLLAGGCAP